MGCPCPFHWRYVGRRHHVHRYRRRPADGVIGISSLQLPVVVLSYYPASGTSPSPPAVTVPTMPSVRPASSTTATWDIYTRSGTAAGHESSATGWTLIESTSITTVANVVYSIPLTSPCALCWNLRVLSAESAGLGSPPLPNRHQPHVHSLSPSPHLLLEGVPVRQQFAGAVSIGSGRYQYRNPIPEPTRSTSPPGPGSLPPLNALACALEQFNLGGDYSSVRPSSIETDARPAKGKGDGRWLRRHATHRPRRRP